ncbi:MAG: ribosome maturation factor RimP [Campylobacterota bacterium]|nr:ribosome maturation factor RimP [Campylobacterota bacterium]
MSLEKDVKSMVESIGLSLYDTSIVSENDETIYRVNVMSQDGVSMDMCVEATKLLSPLLDVTPPVSGEYRLEVSSPGIERKLKTLNHFKHSIGEKVKITTVDQLKIRGLILSVEGNTIIVEDTISMLDASIEFNEISKANTFFEW